MIARQILDDTLYLETNEEMIVVTRKRVRSPINVNVLGDEISFGNYVKPGAEAYVSTKDIRVAGLEISLVGSPDYLIRRPSRTANLGHPDLKKALLRSSFVLQLLYDVSEYDYFVRSAHLMKFIQNVITPLAHGIAQVVYHEDPYVPIIGLGKGFTPSGDDFVSGFVAVFNATSLALNLEEISFSKGFLLSHTNWASAMLLHYVQMGFADEGLSQLVAAVHHEDATAITDSILDLASHGHTSGLDMALGFLLGTAALSDYVTRGSLLSSIMRVLDIEEP